MKKLSVLSIAITLFTTSFAQNNIQQVLLPETFLLPTSESIKLNTFSFDTSGLPYKGLGSPANGKLPLPPQWYINGIPENAQKFSDGVLTLDNSMESATYVAPLGIPAKNPVAISVSFQDPNDLKKTITLVSNITIVEPGKNWYVTYTYSGGENKHSKPPGAGGVETIDNTTKTGTVSMIIEPNPTDEKGYILINQQEGAGKTIDYMASGKLSENSSYVSKDMSGKIDEKIIRKHTGKVTPGEGGLDFEFDPTGKPGEQITLNAGLSFDLTGKDIFWNTNGGRPLKQVDIVNIDEKTARNIGIGHSNDIIHKIPNGFRIDYHFLKDTSYTDAQGNKNNEVSKEDYHFIIKKRYIKEKEKEKLPLEPLIDPKLPLLPLADDSKLPLAPLQ